VVSKQKGYEIEIVCDSSCYCCEGLSLSIICILVQAVTLWLDSQSKGGNNGFRSPYYQRDDGFWLRMQLMTYE
jgi:hypothetical protein